jgi:prephenate dehydratase
VARVKEHHDSGEAAIAGEEAARLHQMAVLKEGIEMNPRNFTRFVVLSKHGALPGLKNKSSLILSVGDQPGALFETLRVFAEHNINLSKLESRPIHDRPWEYLFYVDAEADLSAEPNRPLLEQLQGKTEFFKYLGSYQKGGAAPAEAGGGDKGGLER